MLMRKTNVAIQIDSTIFSFHEIALTVCFSVRTDDKYRDRQRSIDWALNHNLVVHRACNVNFSFLLRTT